MDAISELRVLGKGELRGCSHDGSPFQLHQAGCMVSTAGRVQGSGAQGFATIVVVDLRVQAHFGSDLGYSFKFVD